LSGWCFGLRERMNDRRFSLRREDDAARRAPHDSVEAAACGEAQGFLEWKTVRATTTRRKLQERQKAIVFADRAAIVRGAARSQRAGATTAALESPGDEHATLLTWDPAATAWSTNIGRFAAPARGL